MAESGGSGPRKGSGVDLLFADDVAALLRCSPRTVRRLVQFGRMPGPLKVGRLARWRRSDVERWVADGCPPCRAGVGKAG